MSNIGPIGGSQGPTPMHLPNNEQQLNQMLAKAIDQYKIDILNDHEGAAQKDLQTINDLSKQMDHFRSTLPKELQEPLHEELMQLQSYISSGGKDVNKLMQSENNITNILK